MEINENQNQFIDVLLEQFDKFEWKRDNFEFSTEVGNFNVILDQGQTGTVLRVNCLNEEGEWDQNSVYADDNEKVLEVYHEVFDLWNAKRQERFWKEATEELARIALTTKNPK